MLSPFISQLRALQAVSCLTRPPAPRMGRKVVGHSLCLARERLYLPVVTLTH